MATITETNDHGDWYTTFGLISRVLFWWVVPYLKIGYRGILKLGDLPGVPEPEDSARVSSKLTRCWTAELKRSGDPSFLRACIKCFLSELIVPMSLLTLTLAQVMLQPYLVAQILRHFEPDSTVSRRSAVIYAMFLAISGIVFVLSLPHYYFQSNRVSIRLRAAITCAIYNKILRLSGQSPELNNPGRIINLLSTDLEKCDEISRFDYLWAFPLVALVTSCLLLNEFGPLFLLGLVTCVIVVGISVINAKIYGKLRTVIAENGDRRIAAIKEILSSMKLVKMFCWEDPLSDRVHDLRRKEIHYLTKAAVLRFVNLGVTNILGRAMIFAIFTGSWWLDITFPYSTVIIAIGWLDEFQASCRASVYALEDWLQLTRSLFRIQQFLMAPEHSAVSSKCGSHSSDQPLHPGDITIRNLYARWQTVDTTIDRRRSTGSDNADVQDPSPKSKLLTSVNKSVISCHPHQLRDVSLEVKAVSILTFIFPTAAPFEIYSLLLAMLGELPVSKGDIQVCGDLGYVQQRPWIFNGTIRENILMLEIFDEERYSRVTYACGLNRDIESMPHRDLTLVGERGLMLSGGQKTRVMLARTVYKDLPIYLLDDPLSALDIEVGKHVFRNCICGLMAGKTRIVVTHQLQSLEFADTIAIMDQGLITTVGSFEELENGTNLNCVTYPSGNGIQRRVYGFHKEDRVVYKEHTKEHSIDEEMNEHTEEHAIDEEMNEEGGTNIQVYLGYLKAGYGVVLLPIFLLILFVAVVLLVLSDLFLMKWTIARTEHRHMKAHDSRFNSSPSMDAFQQAITNLHTISDDAFYDDINNKHMWYTILFCCSWACYPIAFVTMAMFMIFAAKNLHQRTFSTVLAAKMRFFDSQPVGRTLNRFSRDIGFIDCPIQYYIWTCFTKGVTLVVFLGTVCVTNAWLTLGLIPLILSLYLLSHVAVRTTRQYKRLEAVARSPLFSAVTDTIAGLPTIRSMKLGQQYMEKFNRLQNIHSAALFMLTATDRFYTLICLVTFWLYQTSMVLLLIFVTAGVSSDLRALSMIYLLSSAYLFQALVRYTFYTEIQMNAVERVLAYTRLPSEAPRSSDNPPPLCWPSRGEILLKHVNMKYCENGPLILRNINLVIKGNEKVGIVGRTGAGKSSIITLLFRLAEQTGEIWIDNVDITKIGLHELRKNISVIPQDPILFAGSLRYNLDMFSELPDSAIWEVLQEVNLKETVERLPGRLYTELTEGGNNFSVGESQLLCLARTILRHNKILILDEATANVDYRTDRIIQETVRRKFADCTVITVAHRLQTIMDSDRVMVLEDGEVKEFDKPDVLLQRRNGHFRRLADKAGLSRGQ